MNALAEKVEIQDLSKLKYEKLRISFSFFGEDEDEKMEEEDNVKFFHVSNEYLAVVKNIGDSFKPRFEPILLTY